MREMLGHTVGFMGDGINDAAMRASDCGTFVVLEAPAQAIQLVLTQLVDAGGFQRIEHKLDAEPIAGELARQPWVIITLLTTSAVMIDNSGSKADRASSRIVCAFIDAPSVIPYSMANRRGSWLR